MKKLVMGVLFAAGLSSVAGAACMLGTAICADDRGNVSIAGMLQNGNGSALPGMTLATMNTTAPTVAGQEIYVSDAVQSRICISSGTSAGAYVVGVASGTFAGASYPHCN